MSALAMIVKPQDVICMLTYSFLSTRDRNVSTLTIERKMRTKQKINSNKEKTVGNTLTLLLKTLVGVSSTMII